MMFSTFVILLFSQMVFVSAGFTTGSIVTVANLLKPTLEKLDSFKSDETTRGLLFGAKNIDKIIGSFNAIVSSDDLSDDSKHFLEQYGNYVQKGLDNPTAVAISEKMKLVETLFNRKVAKYCTSNEQKESCVNDISATIGENIVTFVKSDNFFSQYFFEIITVNGRPYDWSLFDVSINTITMNIEIYLLTVGFELMETIDTLQQKYDNDGDIKSFMSNLLISFEPFMGSSKLADLFPSFFSTFGGNDKFVYAVDRLLNVCVKEVHEFAL